MSHSIVLMGLSQVNVGGLGTRVRVHKVAILRVF